MTCPFSLDEPAQPLPSAASGRGSGPGGLLSFCRLASSSFFFSHSRTPAVLPSLAFFFLVSMAAVNIPEWLLPPAIDPPENLLGSACAIRKTESAGRSVFATRDIPADTTLLTVPKPFVTTVFDDYRKELCGSCFCYDGSRLKVKLPTQDGKRKLRWFCSDKCKDLWVQEAGIEGIQATEIVEDLIQRSARAKSTKATREMEGGRKSGASQTQILRAWEEAEKQGRHIRDLRVMAAAASSEKSRAKILRQAAEGVPVLSQAQDDSDIMRFLADAVVRRYQSDCIMKDGSTPASEDPWLAAMALVPSLQPYTHGTLSTPGKAALASHIRIFLHFCLTFPLKLLPFVTPGTIVGAISRDAGNSFGFWSSDFEPDPEAAKDGYLLGYSLVAHASFFNHSCAPTVKKDRIGRAWEFYAMRDIKEGEELCISYLGGDEQLPLDERQAKLKYGWYFSCRCCKCLEDMSSVQVSIKNRVLISI